VQTGNSWYPKGHEYATHIGQQFSAANPAFAGAGQLSVLSPKNSWSQNVLGSFQTLDFDDVQTRTIHKMVEMGKEGADKDVLSGMRRDVGISGTPLESTTNGVISKALRIRDNEISDPVGPDVFASEGKPNVRIYRKTPDFAHALATAGKSTRFPVDFHAYDAGMDRLDLNANVANDHMKKAHVYDFVQNAYQHAYAHSISNGLIHPDTTFGGYQAMHWSYQKRNKTTSNVRSQASATGETNKVRRWIEENPHWDPTNHGLPPLPAQER
jgi:hypothetical protein